MPVWCDMECSEADWPQDEALDGSGSCRTFLAVYCHKYDRINTKNGPCLDLTLGEDHAVKKSKTKSQSKSKTKPRSKAKTKAKNNYTSKKKT